MKKGPVRLDRRSMLAGVRALTKKDRPLARVVSLHGPPPMWARRPGIATLVRIVLEQQVSLASGKAIYLRLERSLGVVTSKTILHRGEAGLRRLGLTRQKAGYCVGIARSVLGGALNLRRVARASDMDAREELMRVKGIGPWTADIYLLMALRRPDVWPTGDIALHTGLQVLRRLPQRPTSEHAEKIAHRWSPWRSVAARIVWHGYLEGTLRRGGHVR